MRKLLERHLTRIEWDRWTFPVRLSPFVTSDASDPDRPIAIDARVAFGRPVVATSGVSTQAIAERIDAGKSVSALAADHGMSESAIEQAVLHERAA